MRREKRNGNGNGRECMNKYGFVIYVHKTIILSEILKKSF